jgi:hypothetical protein
MDFPLSSYILTIKIYDDTRWPDIAGMILGNRLDWKDVSMLVAASYRPLAPKKLAELVCQR